MLIMSEIWVTYLYKFIEMPGEVGYAEITAEDIASVNSLTAQLNEQLHAQHTSYKVIGKSSQVVAGTNHFFHLEGLPQGNIYTATIFEPLPHTGEPCCVTEVSHGHNHHKNGHSGQH